MRFDLHPSDVRHIVLKTFLELGAQSLTAADEIHETIRIDLGRQVARSYRAEHLYAMWFLRLGMVQFYGPDGEMLRTVNLLQELDGQRVAA